MFHNLCQLIEKRTEKKLIYWWEAKDKIPNVGDHLAHTIVQEVLKLHDKKITDKINYNNKLLTIGSVLHFAKNGDCVWGTGLNGKLDASRNSFIDIDCRAVRGPLTRDFLLSRNINCPEIYGDPALLMPYFFPESMMCDDSKKEFVVVNHMNESMSKYAGYEKHIVSPRQYPGEFLKELLSAEFVVSSSLHGVILAEAYGRPAIYVETGNGESRLKYDDYYYGTGRSSYPVASSIKEALKMSPAELPKIDKIANNLMSAFPIDLWCKSK